MVSLLHSYELVYFKVASSLFRVNVVKKKKD